MNVNDDFTKRVMVHSDSIEWEQSPMAGVERRRLDRIESDLERVTTVVRYAPGSKFSQHVHTGGEEFIVLEGVFEDDYGHWPEGSYIRNPPQSKHTPGSEFGCTIFVKLCQFDPDDRTYVHAQRHKLGAVAERHRDGVYSSPLYKDEYEEVQFEKWLPESQVTVDATGGCEIFVLEGSFQQDGDNLRQHSWLRMPVSSKFIVDTGPEGATVWVKTGHLLTV